MGFVFEEEEAAEGGEVIDPLDLNFIDRLRSRKEFFLMILMANLTKDIKKENEENEVETYFSSGAGECASCRVFVANLTSA